MERILSGERNNSNVDPFDFSELGDEADGSKKEYLVSPDTTYEEVDANLEKYLENDLELKSGLILTVLHDRFQNDPEDFMSVLSSPGVKKKLMELGSYFIYNLVKKVKEHDPEPDEEDDFDGDHLSDDEGLNNETHDNATNMKSIDHEFLDKREAMKNRVHWNFSLDDFKRVAFMMRDKRCGHEFSSLNLRAFVPDKDGKTINFNEQLMVGNPEWERIQDELGEELDIRGVDEWVREEYPKDMDIVLNYLKRIRGTLGKDDRRIGKINENIEKINEFMTNWDGRVPEFCDWYSTIQRQGMSPFLHCYDPKTAIDMAGHTDCRLYMCPQGDRMMDLIGEFKKRCEERGQRFYFKFSEDCDQNDRFIIYTSYEDLDRYIDILNGIGKDEPELFEKMGKHMFWGEIDGAPKGVYFGEEPSQHTRKYEYEEDMWPDKKSYSSVRYEVFDRAFREWMDETFGKEEGKDKYFSSPQEITDDQARKFMEIFRRKLDANDIDPDNFCFDK